MFYHNISTSKGLNAGHHHATPPSWLPSWSAEAPLSPREPGWVGGTNEQSSQPPTNIYTYME